MDTATLSGYVGAKSHINSEGSSSKPVQVEMSSRSSRRATYASFECLKKPATVGKLKKPLPRPALPALTLDDQTENKKKLKCMSGWWLSGEPRVARLLIRPQRSCSCRVSVIDQPLFDLAAPDTRCSQQMHVHTVIPLAAWLN